MNKLPEIPPAPVEFSRDDIAADPILRYFHYDHLPAGLRAVSQPFCELARLVLNLPRNPERSVALRKLLEAKDAAVRANVDAVKTDETWLDRLKREHKELDAKVVSLRTFFDSVEFSRMEGNYQNLLRDQHKAMVEYLIVLSTRLEMAKDAAASETHLQPDMLDELKEDGVTSPRPKNAESNTEPSFKD